MSKWRVEIPAWGTEIEADDEGDVLIQASLNLSFMNEACAEEIEVGENDE
jgi:hypothetical protein